MGEGNCINADVRVRKIKMLFFQQKNHYLVLMLLHWAKVVKLKKGAFCNSSNDKAKGL